METQRIHLCRNCFQPLTKPLSTYFPVYAFGRTGHLCSYPCKRYWKNMSVEERKSVHFEHQRLDKEHNQLDLFDVKSGKNVLDEIADGTFLDSFDES